MRRRLAGLVLCLSLLFPILGAAEFVVGPEATAIPQAYEAPPPFTAYPATNERGFLPAPLSGEAPAFIYANKEEGRFIYIATDLRVEIERRVIKDRGGRHFYFIAHIYFEGDQAFRSYRSNPKNPLRDLAKPEIIARKHQVIYAQNGDLFSYRVHEKRYPGIIIRDGDILYKQTYSRATVNIPPLDELSLYPDGRMEMRPPGELSAEDYLLRGASDVFAFGPMLIRNGVKDPRLVKDFRSPEPRSAIGLVSPGHAVGIMAEGRNKRSKGVPLDFVADRLLEEGCVDAITLDGGQTAAMVFMGEIVMDPGTFSGYTKTRRQPDIVGIGVSSQSLPEH